MLRRNLFARTVIFSYLIFVLYNFHPKGPWGRCKSRIYRNPSICVASCGDGMGFLLFLSSTRARVGGLTVRGVRWRKFTNLGHIANTVCFASSPLIHQWHKFRTQSDRWGVDSSTKGQNLLLEKLLLSSNPTLNLAQPRLPCIDSTHRQKQSSPPSDQPVTSNSLK